MTTTGKGEIVLDGRCRTSLAKVGAQPDSRYVAETYPDGAILLVPAVTIPRWELAALANPEIRPALDASMAAGPGDLITRGSFAEYATP